MSVFSTIRKTFSSLRCIPKDKWGFKEAVIDGTHYLVRLLPYKGTVNAKEADPWWPELDYRFQLKNFDNKELARRFGLIRDSNDPHVYRQPFYLACGKVWNTLTNQFEPLPEEVNGPWGQGDCTESRRVVSAPKGQ